jgi:hypothetical protein
VASTSVPKSGVKALLTKNILENLPYIFIHMYIKNTCRINNLTVFNYTSTEILESIKILKFDSWTQNCTTETD